VFTAYFISSVGGVDNGNSCNITEGAFGSTVRCITSRIPGSCILRQKPNIRTKGFLVAQRAQPRLAASSDVSNVYVSSSMYLARLVDWFIYPEYKPHCRS
jgi:hypothetical protein